MPKRGGWKTVLKYAAGLAALSVSVAAAWFLPGAYAKWQDGQMEGRVVLTPRENIQFIDTTSLDIAGRLLMFEKTKNFWWSWGHDSGNYKGSIGIPEDDSSFGRCRSAMEEWCGAGLFPEECLAGITSENLLLFDTAVVYLDSTTLPVSCFLFWDADGYTVTVVMDAGMGMIYYASVCGPPMLDVIAEDLGYESFEAMAKYELKRLEEYGIAPIEAEALYEDELVSLLTGEGEQAVRPADESRYDFAAVCGAQEMKVSRLEEILRLDVELHFETFTGHAYRMIVAKEYTDYAIGFAVMYGTQGWTELVSDFLGQSGLGMEELEDAADWYILGIGYAIGDPEILNILRYYLADPAQTEAAQGFSANSAYDVYADAESGVGESPAAQSASAYDDAG